MDPKQEICEFALKWIERYRSETISSYELEKGFADECFSIGFVMDCREAFQKAFPDTNGFNDYKSFSEIIDQVDDVQFLGSAIFSKWRYITHWPEANLFEPQYRKWFIAALSRLVDLSSDDN